jgi:hypothetical protein
MLNILNKHKPKKLNRLIGKSFRDKTKSNTSLKQYFEGRNLIFNEEGKILVLDSSNSHSVKFFESQKYFINTATVCSSIASVYNVVNGSVLLSSGMGIATILFMVLRKGLYKNMSRIILKINLIDQGNRIEVTTLKSTFTVEVKSLKLPSKAQTKALLEHNPDLAQMHTPIVIDAPPHRGYFYIPPVESIYTNKELYSAIVLESRKHMITKF